jgi:hypothetical protein
MININIFAKEHFIDNIFIYNLLFLLKILFIFFFQKKRIEI